MQPKPVPPTAQRRNTLTKQQPHPTAPNAALYPTQMTLQPGAIPNYTTGIPAAPQIPAAGSTGNMAGLNPQHVATSQKPYLAAEMAMMQESLKIAALKTAETIRYMTTVRRVGGASRVKGPPPAVANELRAQLARYDQLCDIVEARLIRAHAALSARLKRERAENPQLANAQNQPIQIDSPMSDDVPLSISTSLPTMTAASSTAKYTPAPKSRGLASLAAQHPLNSAPVSAHTISPVTLASNAAVPSALEALPSHHAVIPGLLEALRKQELEQARSALHRPPGQEATAMDMFGATAPIMDELFLSEANPGGVDLDIDSAVAVMDPSVADIDSAVSAMHSAVPDMNSAVAELDSAVAEMAAAGELNPLDPHSDDPLFADLHAHTNPNNDNTAFGAQSAPDSFNADGLQAGGFPGESLPTDDPFATGNIPAGEFSSVSGTGEENKGDLLADLDAAGSSGMDLEMNMGLIEMGGLGIAANEMGHTGDNAGPEGETSLGEGGIGDINLGDVDLPGGGLNMDDVGMDMGGDDDIQAMWSSIGDPLEFFSGIGDDIQIKTEED